MNYHFSRLSRSVVVLFFITAGFALSAQNPASVLPDPDSLSDREISVLATQLLRQAQNFEAELSQNAATAVALRESAEQNLTTAKEDTLTSKETLDSLTSVLKLKKKEEKAAEKNQKQASKTVAFADKVVQMDSTGQRKNIRKAWKQVQELDALLHPPVEAPIASIIGAENVNASPVDSAATIASDTEKRKSSEKKSEKPGPKYKPYDPAADVMLNPPQSPCALAVSTRDEFSGATYRETRPEELFRYTNAVMKKILPPDQPHIVCEAAISNSGADVSLLLTFTIRDANARKSFGSLAKNSIASLKFLDGDTFTLTNTRNDDGARDESSQIFTYRAQYALDGSILKKLRKTELDKLRIAWNTGYEDYEVQGVNVLMREAMCLFE